MIGGTMNNIIREDFQCCLFVSEEMSQWNDITSA